MATANYHKGESFPVQFVWRLPDGDFIRAVFEADVMDIVPVADKYIVHLRQLIAGRQESATGEMRPLEELTRDYWQYVGRLQGRRVTVAFESDTGRPLHMRLETLTGDHNFFFRFDPLSDK